MNAQMNKYRRLFFGLKNIESNAYSSIVAAIRAQGEINWEKQKLLDSLQKVLFISKERHQAEMLRSENDPTIQNLVTNKIHLNRNLINSPLNTDSLGVLEAKLKDRIKSQEEEQPEVFEFNFENIVRSVESEYVYPQVTKKKKVGTKRKRAVVHTSRPKKKQKVIPTREQRKKVPKVDTKKKVPPKQAAIPQYQLPKQYQFTEKFLINLQEFKSLDTVTDYYELQKKAIDDMEKQLLDKSVPIDKKDTLINNLKSKRYKILRLGWNLINHPEVYEKKE